MRDGKPGYERLKVGLAKLGELDLLFTFVNAVGEHNFALLATNRCWC